MNFVNIRDKVLTITSRPDKTALVDYFIDEAVMHFSVRGDFDLDIVETSLAIDGTLLGDTISISSLTRFRRFAYVKLTGTKLMLDKVPPDKMIQCLALVPNTYYLAGTNLTYLLSQLGTALDVGYYQNPPSLTSSDNHWMFEQMPHAIIHYAAAKIFQSIGDDASFRASQALAMEQYTVARNALLQE